MLSPAERKLLDAFKAALAARFGERVHALVLFGSRARGAGRDDSDLDVYVGVRGLTSTERLAIIDLAADLGVEHELVLSPVVTASERDMAPPLRAAIAAEGVPL